MLDAQQLKQDFPLLQRQIHGKSLVYLDNAATSQKPQEVIDAISEYYQKYNANVHRGVHELSNQSTEIWEESRETIANFLGAQPRELIMVRNTTEAANLVAYGWADRNIQQGDIILTTLMEHHSSLVTWQQAAKRSGAELKIIPVTDVGELDLDWFKQECEKNADKIKLLALVHVSNALGTINDLEKVGNILKSTNCRARVFVDGAQSAPHLPIDFQQLKKYGVDFFAFSGHKMLGPMGVGGLLVRPELLGASNSDPELAELQPAFFGGGMIAEVAKQSTIFHSDPIERFTPGTPDVASAHGLAVACTYLRKLGMQNVYEHDRELITYALNKLQEIPEVMIVGPLDPAKRVGSVAFTYQGVHAHDVAQVLDHQGIAVRSGHHCTMPLHTKFEWVATTRVSFQVYNSEADVDALIEGLGRVREMLLVG